MKKYIITLLIFLFSSQFVFGTLGSTGRSTGPHLHYTMYTLENYNQSQSILRMILNNNISNTVISRNALNYIGTNTNPAKKITYNIENFLNNF